MQEAAKLVLSWSRSAPLRKVFRGLCDGAERVDIAVAFVTEGGALALLQALNESGLQARRIRLVAGIDFDATEPAALRLLYGAGVRLFRYAGKATFHPKVYWFSSPDFNDLLLGSANLTGAALSANVEAMLHVRVVPESKLARDVRRLLSTIRRDSVTWTLRRIESYEAQWKPPRSHTREAPQTVSEYLTDRQIYQRLPRRLVFRNREFAFTGYCQFGTHEECAARTCAIGGRTESNRVTRQTHYLVVGANGNPKYVMKRYGRKIQQAVKYRDQTGKPLILTEADWSSRVRAGKMGREELAPV